MSRRGLLVAAIALVAPTAALADPRDRARERAQERRQENRRAYRDEPQRQGREHNRGYGRAEPPRRGYDSPPPGRGQARRGAFLPDYDRGALLNDYGRYRLRAPPRGYGWYRQGDTYLLVDEFTGQVFDVVR